MTIDDVKHNLKSYGYIATSGDDWLINFCIEKVNEHIKSFTNQSKVPAGLKYVALDMATGEVLSAKKQSGELTAITFEAVAKSIQEGDTIVTYATDVSPEKQFDMMIDRMIHGHQAQLVSYRRLKW